MTDTEHKLVASDFISLTKQDRDDYASASKVKETNKKWTTHGAVTMKADKRLSAFIVYLRERYALRAYARRAP